MNSSIDDNISFVISILIFSEKKSDNLGPVYRKVPSDDREVMLIWPHLDFWFLSTSLLGASRSYFLIRRKPSPNSRLYFLLLLLLHNHSKFFFSFLSLSTFIPIFLICCLVQTCPNLPKLVQNCPNLPKFS